MADAFHVTRQIAISFQTNGIVLTETVAGIFRVQRSSFIREQHLFPKNRLAENDEIFDENKRLKLWFVIASRILEIPAEIAASGTLPPGKQSGNADINNPTITCDFADSNNGREAHYDFYKNLR